MATHIEHHAAAGTADIPEPGRVGAGVFFGLSGKERFADRAFVDQLFDAYIFWGKQQLFGVHQQHAGFVAGRDHFVGLFKRDTQRFFDNDVFAGPGGIHNHLAVQVVRNADIDHIDIRFLQHGAVIAEGARDVAFLREMRRVIRAGNSNDIGIMHPAGKCGMVNIADEPCSDDADVDGRFHSISPLGAEFSVRCMGAPVRAALPGRLYCRNAFWRP
jgi:hypothetical protein